MFNGIKPKTFLNTPEEWHALAIGFFEVLCPWPARTWLSGPSLESLLKEYHYYMTGRGLGFVAFLFLLRGVVKFIMEVVL
jgi:hypothetical protein